MDFDIATKILLGCVSSLGTMALVFFNLSQTKKIKAELLEKFEYAVSRENKHSVTELFRLIHGLLMRYADIIELISHDSCSKIIFSLQKTPSLVLYVNGEFRYTKQARNKLFRFIDRWFLRLSIFILGVLTLVSLDLLGFGSGAMAVVGFISLIFSSMLLAIQLRQQRCDQMVGDLVEPEHNVLMPLASNAGS